MKKTIFLLPILLFAINATKGQITFEKKFGGTGTGAGVGAVQTSDGGFATAGYIYANGISGIDLNLVKLNANGDVIWNKTYGGLEADYTNGGFEQTADDGFILLGYNSTGASFTNRVLKLNLNGDTVWTKTFLLRSANTYLFIQNVHQVKDGGYIFIGTYEDDSAFASYPALIKTDGNGGILWSKLYSSLDSSNYYNIAGGGFDVLETADNGFIITGYGTTSFPDTSNSYSVYDVNLIKTNSTGSPLWTKEINLDASGGYSFIKQDPDGGYVLTDLPYSGDSTYLLKVNNAGNLSWVKNYYTSIGAMEDANLNITTGGDYILSGALLNTGQTGIYGHIIKVNSSGDTLWTRRFGPAFEYTQFSSAFQHSNGSYVATGISEATRGGTSDMYIVKTDDNGNTKCTENYNIVYVESISPAETNTTINSGSLVVNSTSWKVSVNSSGTDKYWCDPTGIADITISNRVSVYPNPAHDIINLDVPSDMALSSIEIYDVTGRRVFPRNISLKLNHSMIDMSANEPGYYFVRLNSAKEIINACFILQ